MQKYRNPIIRGFNPDPSICRVGQEFFLVTSSFEYFPGVPIYKSNNLVNWKCIGHCLTRKSQLKLDGCKASEGIYAPTLRYYDGTFYMVTTNVSGGGNFIVHTKDIYGEWSEPVWIDQGGIDPSLLFADDRVYFVSNEDCSGNHGIYMCEIDPQTGERLTQSRLISRGCGGRYPEAPHVYKIGQTYYLMLAEGGTEYGHMVTILRSSNPYGPYKTCPHNPILSHRCLERMDINCVGHADLVDDENGNWWMTALGTRTIEYEGRRPMLHNLGRETNLVSVTFSDGWPQVGINGILKPQMEAELPAKVLPQFREQTETLETLCVAHALTYIRNPEESCYELYPLENRLVLNKSEVLLSEEGKSPAFVGIRQSEPNMTASVKVFPQHLAEKGCAGMTVFYNHEHHYDLIITRHEDTYYAAVRKRVYDIEVMTAKRKLHSLTDITFKITADNEYYRFYVNEKGKEFLIDEGTTAALCTEITRRMTFTGTFVGMFAEKAVVEYRDICITMHANSDDFLD